jgi:hypothetical protein
MLEEAEVKEIRSVREMRLEEPEVAVATMEELAGEQIMIDNAYCSMALMPRIQIVRSLVPNGINLGRTVERTLLMKGRELVAGPRLTGVEDKLDEEVAVEIPVLDQVVEELLVRLLFRSNPATPVLSHRRVVAAEPVLVLERTKRTVVLPRIDGYTTRMRRMILYISMNYI